ncbi:MAG: hypothetical protein P4L92_16865 [Rudaea sp.]|nr:hypothetical protein [Rudaea sp.]
MHGNVETGLAFILFFPAFCIAGVLYCLFPRKHRSALRLLADLAVLILAAALSLLAVRWGFHSSLGVGGSVWKQVAATLLAYGVFLGVIGVALPIRAWVLRRGCVG